MQPSIIPPARLLRLIGMHPRYKGYAYILHILTIAEEKPECIYNLRQSVYPILVKRFNCTVAGIERNIRFVVQRTFESGNLPLLSRIFYYNTPSWTPSNTEFIAMLTQCVHYGFSEMPVENTGDMC